MGRSPPQDCAKAGLQLNQIKGFEQIVVRTATQPLNAIVDGIARTQDQAGQALAAIWAMQLRQNFHAVHIGQSQIQNQGIKAMFLQQGKTNPPRRSGANCISLPLQMACQQAQQRPVVFNNQNSFHQTTVRNRAHDSSK